MVKLWSKMSVFRNAQLFELKNKRKVPKTEVFGTFVVEISGIEPLTS